MELASILQRARSCHCALLLHPTNHRPTLAIESEIKINMSNSDDDTEIRIACISEDFPFHWPPRNRYDAQAFRELCSVRSRGSTAWIDKFEAHLEEAQRAARESGQCGDAPVPPDDWDVTSVSEKFDWPMAAKGRPSLVDSYRRVYGLSLEASFRYRCAIRQSIAKHIARKEAAKDTATITGVVEEDETEIDGEDTERGTTVGTTGYSSTTRKDVGRETGIWSKRDMRKIRKREKQARRRRREASRERRRRTRDGSQDESTVRGDINAETTIIKVTVRGSSRSSRVSVTLPESSRRFRVSVTFE